MSRREAGTALFLSSAAAVLAPTLLAADGVSTRRMKINLMCGMIGVSAGQNDAIDLAHQHGFESVEPYASHLASLDNTQLAELKEKLKVKSLVWGAAGLPVEFRRDEEQFNSGIKAFPKIAAALQRAGVTRIGTWLMPGSDSLTYLQNFRQHTHRLRRVAEIAKDHGLRFGLEYVGTKTLRDRFRFEFAHTMTETKELIAEIGTGNVGFVLDSWHWWNAGEKGEDILSLRTEEIVAVDLNDAPAGIPREKQMDGQRELPAATGVINIADFLKALDRVGYDGPVRAEPFNKVLNDLPNDEACALTVRAIRKAFAQVWTEPG